MEFVIWMTCYPVSCALSRFLVNKSYEFKVSEGSVAMAMLVEFTIWIFVGIALFIKEGA